MKKHRILILFSLSVFVPTGHAELDYAPYAELLSRYVEADGVRYAAWAKDAGDRATLKKFLNDAAGVDVSSLDRQAQTAFYINLYNASMLQAVFEHWPIDSVKEIGPEPFSIFKKAFIEQGKRRLSLDEVEKGILLEEYFDPRIHFAVNCASESCPPLRAEPFVGGRLQLQLEVQTRKFAESARAARVDPVEKSVAYSELFKWYAGDFSGDSPVGYLNRYRAAPLPADFKTEWIPYDWSLNVAE